MEWMELGLSENGRHFMGSSKKNSKFLIKLPYLCLYYGLSVFLTQKSSVAALEREEQKRVEQGIWLLSAKGYQHTHTIVSQGIL